MLTRSQFQGGAFDPWGGAGFEKCAQLTGPEMERVYYKNLYGFHITIFNVYMTFGGTNWFVLICRAFDPADNLRRGNLGHPGGYSSYDYGSVISENRAVDREKYSEAKLQANFIVSMPEYLEAVPADHFLAGKGYLSSNDLVVTPLANNAKGTKFWVIR